MYGPQPRKRKERLVTELPTAPFVQVKVFMISKLMKKVLNRESISYIIFGVLTTLVDWASYALFWSLGWDYKVSTALSWAAAVLFAFVTNKFWVFRSFTLKLSYLRKEFVSFVACRAATGVLTMLGMILMVDGFHWNEFLGKLMVSAMSLVLNYIMSKLFIFKKKKDEEKEHGAG